MPLKAISQRRHTHTLATHFAWLLLFALLAAAPAGAHAQGKKGARARTPRAQTTAANDNAAQSEPKPQRPKKFISAGRSDTAQGSRVTIKSDNALNDYSAYRSGDRFYVKVPNANAGSIPKGGSGRGYTDMEVQQQGNDVVLSYRLKPGVKPRVAQKFNSLDVVFDTGGAPADADKPAPDKPAQTGAAQQTGAPTTTGEGRNATAPPQTREAPQNTRSPASSQAETPSTSGHQHAGATHQGEPSVVSATPEGAAAPPVLEVPAPLTNTLPTPAQAPTPATAAPTAATQVAQAQPPAPVGPVSRTNEPAAQPGMSLGTVILRNWPVALTLALLMIGIGLFIAARRSSATGRPALDAPTAVEPEPRRLEKRAERRELKTAAPVAVPVASVPPVAAASALAAQPASEPSQPAAVVETATATETAAEAAGVSAVTGETKALTDETKATVADETAQTAVADETKIVAVESAALESAALESAAPGEAPAAAVAETTTQEIAPVETVETAAPVELAGAVAAAGLVHAAASDADRVQDETHRLLRGEEYDRGVIGAADDLSRQLVAAELLAALAGRNVERRERARAAFAEHGFFDEAVNDLRRAAATAERASAARSLALAGDRGATRHLVAALEDRAVEVRRAAVEALASLRDPQAVEPLRALLRREKNQKAKVPRKLVQHAVDVCVQSVKEEPSARAVAEKRAFTPTPPAQSSAPAAAPDATVAEAGAAADESAAVADESAALVTAVPSPVVEEVLSNVADAAPVGEAAAAASVEEALAPPVEEAAAAPVEVEETVETHAPAFDAAVEEETIDAERAAPVEEVTAEIAPYAEPEAPAAVEEPRAVFGREEFTAEVTGAAPASELTEYAPAFEVAEAAPAAEVADAAEVAHLAEIEPAAPVAEVESAAPVAGVEEELDAGTWPFEKPAAAEAPGPVGAEEAAAKVEVEQFESAFRFGAAESAAPGVVDEAEIETIQAAPVEAAPAAGRDEKPAARAEAGEWFEFDMAEMSSAHEARSIQPFADAHESTAVETHAALADTAPQEAVPVEATVETAVEIAEPVGRAGAGSAETLAGAVAPPSLDDEKAVAPLDDELSTVPKAIQLRLASEEPADRVKAIADLSRLDTEDAFHHICAGFDDPSEQVRSAAARSLYEMSDDRAESFTRALRDAEPARRRHIGAAIAASGLASEAIGQLTGESRDRTYDAFSLLFLMAKAGEVQPLIRAIEMHPDTEVRLAVVKLLALSGQKDVLPAFRRLAVRGSLPTEVRSAVMEAIYQISSQSPSNTSPVA